MYRAFLLILFLSVTACTNYDAYTPDEKAETAIALAKDGNYGKARTLLREAATGGSLCAVQYVAELYHPKRFTGRPGDWYFELSQRWTPDEALASQWSETFMTALYQAADEGNQEAMLWLYFGRKNYFAGSGLGAMERNDSLATIWLHRAAEAGSAVAHRLMAQGAVNDEDFARADSLFEQAVTLGDDWAYQLWSMMYLSPSLGDAGTIHHFEVASKALDANAAGVHSWLGGEINKLVEQARLDNPDALRFLAVADSLNIRPRLAALQDTTSLPGRNYFPTICPQGA